MNLKRNLSVLKFEQFFFNFYPISALLVVYFYQITHSYAVAMAVFSLSSAVRSFAEIPAGMITDRIGCRKVLMCVAFLALICYFMWLLSGIYMYESLLFCGAFFLGLSKALYSGTTEALIFRTVSELKKDGITKTYNEVYANSNVCAQIGLACSALLAAAVSYYYNLSVLLWLTILSLIVQFCIAGCFVEPKLQKAHAAAWLDFRMALRLLWKNSFLKTFMMISLLNNSVERAVNNFEALYFKATVADWMINVLRFIKQFFGACGFIVAAKIDKKHNLRLYAACVFLNSIFRGVAVWLNNIFAPFLMVFTNVFYGSFITASTSTLQHEFSNRQRRTMQSFVSFVGGLTEVGILTAFGFLADVFSPRISILFAVGINMFVLVTGAIIAKRIRTK